ncbi:MAG: flagellar biosynthetic protein FliR [bacterium]
MIDQGALLQLAVTFGFVLMRVLAVLAAFPLWSGRLPLPWKIAAALWLSVVAAFALPARSLPETWSAAGLVLGAAGEVLTGATLGLVGRLFLGGITLAGEITGLQMGFGVATVFDPSSGESHSVIAQCFNIFAMFVLLEMDSHLLAVRVLMESFERIPPFAFPANGPVFLQMVREGGGQVFRVAVELAWPLSLCLLLVYLSMGLLARVAPQINLMMVGFPLTIAVGVFVLWLSVPSLTASMERVCGEMWVGVETWLTAMGR